MEIINGDLHEAHELYYYDEYVAVTMSFYYHNITPEKARKHLAHNRIIYVGEEHFIKKAKVV